MSEADASAGEPPAEPPRTIDRDELLAMLDDGIAEAHRKLTSGRVYDPENERVRMGWLKALAYAANVRRQVTRDKDLDDIAERVAELESANGDEPIKVAP